jgi:hypothetical protein
MYSIMTSNSKLLCFTIDYVGKKNCHVITSSTLDEKWLKNYKEVKLDKLDFYMLEEVNPEKGIYEFLKMFEK